MFRILIQDAGDVERPRYIEFVVPRIVFLFGDKGIVIEQIYEHSRDQRCSLEPNKPKYYCFNNSINSNNKH